MTLLGTTAIEDNNKCQELLQAVIRSIGRPLSPLEESWCTSSVLHRYLRARKGNVSKAAKLLQSTLVWRSEIDISSLKIDEFSPEIKSGKMYVQGHDTQGRSILVTRKRSDAFQPGDTHHYLRHLTFTLETASKNMSKGADSWVWLMDMQGMTRANSPPLNVSFTTLHILADHFPECLHKCYMIDAPSIFSYLWAALSPFLDPVTKQKVVFIKSADWHDKMKGHQLTQGAHDGMTPDDFSILYEVYCSHYNESDYRELLIPLWPQ